MLRILFAIGMLGYITSLAAQPFYFGADLSYVNQMEDCGAVFREGGQPRDPYALFAAQGCNLVRVRLWVDPQWQNGLQQPAGVLPQYSDFADVRETCARAKAAGMAVLLDFQYSDFWADPGRQVVPARWAPVAYQTAALGDSIYQYTFRTLRALDSLGLMPELVQIGNETNRGLMTHLGMNAAYEAQTLISSDWARHAQLFNRAIQAVRAAGALSATAPQIAIHFAGLSDLSWRFQNLASHGVSDFDILGFSYYYAWHGGSFAQLGQSIGALRQAFPGKQVMVLETSYPWTSQNHDPLPNIAGTPAPGYQPLSHAMQLAYLGDCARAVIAAGGNGMIVWEPAWLSTPCRTPWGQGSSHDHIAFFEPASGNLTPGIEWMDRSRYSDLLGTAPAPARWEVYPNPASGLIHLRTCLPVEAELYDLAGRKLLSRSLLPQDCRASLDLSGLAPQVYLLRLRGESGSSGWQKLVRW